MYLRVIFLVSSLSLCYSAKILCVFSTPFFSHIQSFQPIYNQLSNRGHQVTVITPLSLNRRQNISSNIVEFEIPTIFDIVKEYSDRTTKISKDKSLLTVLGNSVGYHVRYVKEILIHLDKIFPDPTTEFDVIVVEHLSHLLYSLKCRFKAPIVGITPSILLSFEHSFLGNIAHPSLTPNLPSKLEKETTFFSKISNIFSNVLLEIFFHTSYFSWINKIAKEHFGHSCSSIQNMVTNVSVVLTHTGPILTEVRSNVPTLIEMGGPLHLQQQEPLPNDVQNYLDSSSQGVIYFSLGSISKNSDFPNTTRNAIIKALSELPYNVLWKFDDDSLANPPRNIMTKKWLPQQDILRHPNVKVFVNHGGLLSVEESVIYGVPVVAIPLVFDQPAVAKKVVELGIGQRLDYTTLTEDQLKKAIIEVASNIKYKGAMKKVSHLFQDQPVKQLDKAIWWIEYTIRHKEATHLKSPSIHISWFEYFLLDLVFVIFSVLFGICFVIIIAANIILRIL